MDHERRTRSLSGQVTDIFAHRFVVQRDKGKVLADLGPKGAEQVSLRVGDQVDLIGEMKPSELKVHSIARNGERRVLIEHPGRPDHPLHEPDAADPKVAIKTAEANGFAVVGEPRRKPKHFEVLGRDAAGDIVELHIELGGALHKTKPVHEDDPKWATEIKAGR
jgi:hypothetical protein